MGNKKSKDKKSTGELKTRQDANIILQTHQQQHHILLNIIDAQFEYLSRFKDEEEIFSTKNIDNILKHLLILSNQVCNEELKTDILKLACKHNIEDFFVPALNCCIEFVNEYFFELFRNNRHEISEHVWKAAKLFLLSLSFMDYLLIYPTIVTEKFHKKNCTKVLLKYLTKENFLKNCISFAENSSNHKYSIREDFSEMLMIALHNMSKVANIFSKDFEDLQIKKIVFNYISCVKSLHRHDKVLRGYLILVNVFNEHDYSTIPESSIIIDSIMKILRNTAKSINKGKHIDRRRASIDPIHEVNDDVTFVTDKSDYEWNSIEIMQDLYRLVVHDSLKFQIYEKYDAKNILSKIILGNSNETEKQYSMKLLWQLCFDKDVLADFSKNHKLIDYITAMSNDRLIKNNILKMKCFGLLWMLKRKFILEQKSGNFDDSTKHIMISYNHETHEFASKIKEWLENLNYNVLLFPENYHTLDFDEIMKAIDNSFCVIVCLNQDYKQSNMCRTVCSQ
jgi:hypothetical protein